MVDGHKLQTDLLIQVNGATSKGNSITKAVTTDGFSSMSIKSDILPLSLAMKPWRLSSGEDKSSVLTTVEKRVAWSIGHWTTVMACI